MINSLASILYSSTNLVDGKQQTSNRSSRTLNPLKPTDKSLCQLNMLFRSSTPKTSLTMAPESARRSSTERSNASSSIVVSMKSSQTPRCSTPVYSKQRRTRPFIVCELCRQRAIQTPKKIPSRVHRKLDHETHKACQYTTTQRTFPQRHTSMDQLLVWIV